MPFQLLSGDKVYLTEILHHIKDVGIPVRTFKTSCQRGDSIAYLTPNFRVSWLGTEIFQKTMFEVGKNQKKIFNFIFIYFEGEMESKWGRGREEGDRIPSRSAPVGAEPDVGLKLRICEVKT